MGCGVKHIGFPILTPLLKTCINMGKRLGPSVPWLFPSAKGIITVPTS